MSEVPRQWHVYMVDLEPRIGTKPGKQRPCLAIQHSVFAESGLGSTVVLPLTTHLVVGDAHPLRVRIPKGICGLTQTSDLLVSQILAWDNRLFKESLGELPDALKVTVRAAMKEFLDLA